MSGDDTVELVDDGDLSIAYRVRRTYGRHSKLVVFLVSVLVIAGIATAIALALKKPKSVSKGM